MIFFIRMLQFFVKEYNGEAESRIRSILYSSRSIRMQIFCMLAIRLRYRNSLGPPNSSWSCLQKHDIIA